MNEFFDIGKMPTWTWLLWFPISISNIPNKQDPLKCLEYVEIFSTKSHEERRDNWIGVHFSYTDFLYLYNDSSTASVKNKYMNMELNHKNGVLNLLKKDKKYSLGFFSFGVWNQLYLDIKWGLHFPELLRDLRKIYDNDQLFQKYMKEDAKLFGKELDENQINFFLEEHLMVYLVNKWMIWFPQNDFIRDRQDWILMCYPGTMLKHLAYILQKNFFKLENPKNIYEDCLYDTNKRLLYDVSRLDLETYNYE